MVSLQRTSGFQTKNRWFPFGEPVVFKQRTIGFRSENQWFFVCCKGTSTGIKTHWVFWKPKKADKEKEKEKEKDREKERDKKEKEKENGKGRDRDNEKETGRDRKNKKESVRGNKLFLPFVQLHEVRSLRCALNNSC